MTLTDVIIPARNEALTVGAIVEAFTYVPHVGNVFVSVDDDTMDATASVAANAGAVVVRSDHTGKGQVIQAALGLVHTEQTILCDADLTGLTPDHIEMLLGEGHTVGVPDFPTTEVQSSEVVMRNPEWYKRIVETWAFITGERNVPTAILYGIELHGYLTEVQINNACVKAGLEFNVRYLRGCHSPFLMTRKRFQEMERDREWATRKGMFAELCKGWESCNRGIMCLWLGALQPPGPGNAVCSLPPIAARG